MFYFCFRNIEFIVTIQYLHGYDEKIHLKLLSAMGFFHFYHIFTVLAVNASTYSE